MNRESRGIPRDCIGTPTNSFHGISSQEPPLLHHLSSQYLLSAFWEGRVPNPREAQGSEGRLCPQGAPSHRAGGRAGNARTPRTKRQRVNVPGWTPGKAEGGREPPGTLCREAEPGEEDVPVPNTTEDGQAHRTVANAYSVSAMPAPRAPGARQKRSKNFHAETIPKASSPGSPAPPRLPKARLSR